MTPQFTTPCFVRVEDAEKRKEICEQLGELGYRCARVGRQSNEVVITRGADYSVDYIPFGDTTINCGTNTELFLALAAMRSDTAKGQWFVSHGFKMFYKLKGTVETSTGRKSIGAGEWFKPLVENIKFKWLGNPEFHRATAQEIIERFNK